MSKEKSREIKKEVENAKEEVAKGEYNNGMWQLILPLLMMSFFPFGDNKEEKTKTAETDKSAEGNDVNDDQILEMFAANAQKRIDYIIEKFDNNEFQKFLVHVIACEIEEIKRKQADMQCSIETLKFTLFNAVPPSAVPQGVD